jgi:hypothetical protein
MKLTARLLYPLLFDLLLTGSLCAQDDFEDYGPKPSGGAKAEAWHRATLAEHNDNTDMLVLPGLVADRKQRRVEVLAECTGLRAGEAVEFLLIDQGSSHGYEGLLWSHARPSDVHRALEFIGLKPGTPFNPAQLRFWADGDRVNISVQDKTEDDGDLVPIERLILDKESGETLPEEGFIFVGSLVMPARDGKGEVQYVADAYDPRSIASIYNEPAAVLDVPRQVSKGEVYGKQVVNPDKAFPGGELLTLVMTPGDPDGQSRVRHLSLSIDHVAISNGVNCRLSEADGKLLHEEVSIKAMMERLVSLGQGKTASYLDLTFGDALPVTLVGKCCLLMALTESMGIVKIDAPGEGQLYYRAFVPDKAWAEPEGRPVQPWELHLSPTNATVTGELVLNEEFWSEGVLTPRLERKAVAVADAEALRSALDRDSQEREAADRSRLPAVLLVFADASLPHGELMRFINPIMTTHATVYVFVKE